MTREQAPFMITRTQLFAVAFLVLFLALLYLAAGLLVPFFTALLWAAVLVVVLHPLYRRIVSLLGGRSGAAAALVTAGAALVVIVPLLVLSAALASQAIGFYQWTVESVGSGDTARAGNRLIAAVSSIFSHPLFAGVDLKAAAVKGISQTSLMLADQLGGAIRNVVRLSLNLVLMLIALFFFFRDGERYFNAVISILPFPREHQRIVAAKIRQTFTAILGGVMLIALLQGFLTGLGFFLFGVPFPVLWGFLASALALLPLGGAALVWIPGCLFLLMGGTVLKGALLALWGLLLITLPDNILKPLLIGKKTGLPAFFLFLGILGGVQSYGFLGVLAGPLIMTLFIAFFRIFRDEYLAEKPQLD